MREIVLNGELRARIPEGFHELDGEERSRLRFLEEGPGVCLSDPERHILATMGWKRVGAFAAFVLNARDIAANAQKRVRRAMRSQDYRCLGFSEREIALARAAGFRYAYSADGVGMVAETYAARIGRTIYYFHVYAREAAAQSSLAVWSGILNGIEPAR